MKKILVLNVFLVFFLFPFGAVKMSQRKRGLFFVLFWREFWERRRKKIKENINGDAKYKILIQLINDYVV